MKQLLSTTLLVLVDTAVLFVSIVLAFYLREMFNTVVDTEFMMPLQKYTHFYLLYIAVLGMLVYEGIYTKRYDFWEEYKKILKAVTAAFVIVFTYLSLTKSAQQYSRLYFVLLFLLLPVLYGFVKPLIKHLLCKLGIWEKKVYVSGDGSQASDLKKEIKNNSYLGYSLSSKAKAKVVLIATKNMGPTELKSRLEEQFESKKEIIVVPYLDNYNIANTTVYELFNSHMSLLSIENKLLIKHNRFVKNLMEYLLIFILFPVILTVVLIVSLWIKLDSKGPVLFLQKRLGQNGRVFTCYKFRTMFTNSHQLLQAYLQKYPDEHEVYERYHKYTNDPRITTAGRWIRKFSLDELPQVFNILMGDMSLIGPRPYMKEETDKLQNHRDMILKVKPGITGLWQVGGRNELEFEQRIKLDVWYIQNWTLWTDLVIFVKTFSVLLLRKGAK